MAEEDDAPDVPLVGADPGPVPTEGDVDLPTLGQLPPIYTAYATARQHGYSWDQINGAMAGARQAALKAGYTDLDFDRVTGVTPLDTSPATKPPSPGEWLPSKMRQLADTYLQPGQTAPSNTAGVFAKLGWDVTNVSKMFGHEVVDGAAAALEAINKPVIPKEYQDHLIEQAAPFFNFLDAFGEGLQGTGVFTPEGKALSAAAKGLEAGPKMEDFVDAAATLARTPDQLPTTMKLLGRNYAETGEHPMAAAVRLSGSNDHDAAETLAEEQAARASAKNAAEGLGFEEAPAHGATGITFDEPEVPAGAAPAEGTYFRIFDNGQPIAGGRYSIAGKTATIHSLVSLNTDAASGESGALGSTTMRRIIRQFKQDHPDITSIKGMRISGARVGPAATEEMNPEINLNLAAEETGAVDDVMGEKVEGPTTTFTLRSGADLLKDEEGAVHLPPSWSLQIDPESIGKHNPALNTGLVGGLRLLLAPQSLAPEAAGIIRGGLAKSRAALAFASETLNRFARAVGDMASVDRVDYLDAFEHGDMSAYHGTPMDTFYKQSNVFMDRLWDEMHKAGIDVGYIENYMKHWWTDPDGFAHVLSTRRPLEGSRTHMRTRTYEYIREGLDAGLKLVTDNPVKLQLHAIGDMLRHIYGHKIIQELIANNMVQAVQPGARGAVGLTQINDPGFFRGVRYYGTRPVATMLNRILAPSAFDIYTPLSAIKSASTMATAGRLFLSGAHATYVTAAGINQALAKSIQALSRFDIPEAAKALTMVPLSPVRYAMDGVRLIRQITGIKNYTGEVPWLTQQYIRAGGRINWDQSLNSSAAGSFLQSLRGTVFPNSGRMTLGQDLGEMFRNAEPLRLGSATIAPAWLNAGIRLLPRIMDTAASLLLTYAQIMKQGAWMDRMRPYLDNGAISPEMLRQIGIRHLDNMDNILGQMVSDHLFWNKTAIDAGNTSLLAHTWFLGKVRAMTSAPAEAASYLGGLFSGHPQELGPNAASVIAAIPTAMFFGAGYALFHGTWDLLKTSFDYFYPPTGGTNRDGTPERANIFTFFRDIYSLATEPVTAAENRINPVWTALEDLRTNTQWNGAAIHDPSLPLPTQAGEYQRWLWQQFGPIASEQPGYSPHTGLTELDHFFGTMPANEGITNPARVEKFEQRDTNTAVKKLHRAEQEEQQ